MPLVRFLVDYIVKDADRTTYAKGQEVDLNEASCLHFESRGAAVRVSDAPAPAPKARPQETPAVEDLSPFCLDGGQGLSDALAAVLKPRAATRAERELAELGAVDGQTFVELSLTDRDALLGVYGVNEDNLDALLAKVRC